MRKLLVTGCWLLVLIIGLNTPVYAQEASASSTVQQKLDELKKEIASKAASLKKEISNKLENKAYTGVIKQKSANSITLATQNGTKIISINQDTVFEGTAPKAGAKKPTVTKDTLKDEANISALGDVDDTGSLIAKKIVLLANDGKNKKTIIWGEIISISADLLTIRGKDLKNTTVSVLSTSDLRKGENAIKAKDLLVNTYVIVSGLMSEDNELEAALIYVIPQEGIIKPKEASGTATVSPTPSPKPVATTKPTATPKVSATPKATAKPTVKPSATPQE